MSNIYCTFTDMYEYTYREVCTVQYLYSYNFQYVEIRMKK